MLDTRTDSNRMRRLLRAAIPVTPTPPPDTPLSSSTSHRRSSATRLRARVLRGRCLSLMLALAVAAAVLVHDAPPAQAGAAPTLGDEERMLMLGTLTVADGGSWRGYRRSPSTGQLTRSGFSYDGASYAINRLVEHNTSNFLILVLDKAIPAGVKSGLALHVADRRFDLADGEINPNDSKEIRWANSGESWTAGEQFHVTVTYTDYWSATLTVQDLSASGVGCDSGFSTPALRCETSTTLTDDTITLGSTTHTISYIQIGPHADTNQPTLFLGLDGVDESYGAASVLSRYTLHVGNVSFELSDATRNSTQDADAYWSNPGITWSEGQTVELRLTKPRFTGVKFVQLFSTDELDEVSVRENGVFSLHVVLPRDPGSGNTVTVHLFRPAFNCSGCGDHSLPDREAISISSADNDTDSYPETVTLKFTGGTSGNWSTGQFLDVSGVVDADGSHEHAMVWATVSTTSTDQYDWYRQPDGAAGLYVTVTETGDDGTHGGVGGQNNLGTEGEQGSLKRPDDVEPEPQVPPAPPQNVKVVPGDGRLTVSWDVGSREGVEDEDIRHALRWTQTPGRWTNTHFPHVSASDGQIVYGSKSSYVITGLRNGVAANVEIRAFTGGNHYERAESTSEWVKIKGPQTTPNSPPTVASPIADIGPLVVGDDATVDLSEVFADSDGDTLTITAESTDDFVSVALIRYTPSPEAWVLAMGRGVAELTVTADDGNGGTVSDKFTVTVKEAPTVANPIADIAGLDAGTSKLISLSGVFADADGDTLTLSAASSDTAVATVSAQLDPATGSATAITVTAVSSGTVTVTVTARDSDGNTVADTFEVTVPAAQQQTQYQGGSSDNSDKKSPQNGSDEDALPEEFDPPTDEHALEEPIVLIPGAVHNLTLTATDNGVRVIWDAPTVGSAPTRYIVHLKPEGGETGSGKTKRPKAKKTQVTYNKLEPGATYQVWVRAQNALGKGERTHATITLPDPQPGQ